MYVNFNKSTVRYNFHACKILKLSDNNDYLIYKMFKIQVFVHTFIIRTIKVCIKVEFIDLIVNNMKFVIHVKNIENM